MLLVVGQNFCTRERCFQVIRVLMSRKIFTFLQKIKRSQWQKAFEKNLHTLYINLGWYSRCYQIINSSDGQQVQPEKFWAVPVEKFRFWFSPVQLEDMQAVPVAPVLPGYPFSHPCSRSIFQLKSIRTEIIKYGMYSKIIYSMGEFLYFNF